MTLLIGGIDPTVDAKGLIKLRQSPGLQVSLLLFTPHLPKKEKTLTCSVNPLVH